MSVSVVEVLEVRVADEAQAWRAAGFTVEGDLCVVGSVALRLVGRRHGLGHGRLQACGAGGASPDGAAGMVPPTSKNE